MRQKINTWQFIFVMGLLLVALTLAFCGCGLDTEGNTPSPYVGDHFYTTNPGERNNAIAAAGYIEEPIACYVFEKRPISFAPQANVIVPFYRLYNQGNGNRIYTTSEAEKTNALTLGYQDDQSCYIFEGRPSGCVSVAGYIFQNPKDGYAPPPGTVPLYRLYHPVTGDRFYTTSETERTNVLNPSIGYIDDQYCHIYEGGPPGYISTAGYVFPVPKFGAAPPTGTIPLFRLYHP